MLSEEIQRNGRTRANPAMANEQNGPSVRAVKAITLLDKLQSAAMQQRAAMRRVSQACQV